MTDTTVVGSFATRTEARQAVHALRSAGIADSSIGVIARDGTRTNTQEKDAIDHDPTGSRWEEGTGIGAAAGGATGLGLGLAVAAGLIPGIGPVLAGGALVALLASVGAGAAAGTVVGGLIGLGVPEEDADYYGTEVESGRSLVVVRAGSRHADVRDIIRHNGGMLRATPAMAAR